MPRHSRKRKRDHYEGDNDEYVRKKMKRLEKMLRHRRRRHRRDSTSYSESSSDRSHSYYKDMPSKGEDQRMFQDESRSVSVDPYDLLLNDESDEHNDVHTEIPHRDYSIQGPVTQDCDTVNPVSSNQTITANTATEKPPVDVQESQNEIVNQPIPSTSVPVTHEKEPELDQEILELLGETPTKDKKYGPNIKTELAIRWNHILTTGLTKENRKELLDKYLIPDNCKNIDAPILNPETKAALSEVLIKKDKAIEAKQKRIAASISSLGDAVTRLLDLGFKDSSVMKPLLDAARLICDVQHTESLIRRNFICSTLKKDFKDQLYNTDIDKYLFSEKLADTLKTAKAIQKSGTDMKNSNQKPKPVSNNRPLNLRPPLPGSRPAGALRKLEPAADASRRQQAKPQQQTLSAPPRSRPRSYAPPNQRRRY